MNEPNIKTIKVNNSMLRNYLFSILHKHDAQSLMLQYIKEEKETDLQYLLRENRVNVNYIYEDEHEKYKYNALQIACACFSDSTSLYCIGKLLKKGVDVFYTDPFTKKNSIHLAAESGDSYILKTILEHVKNTPNYTENINDSIIIHTLIKTIWQHKENEENFIPNLKVLLMDKYMNIINNEDKETGQTAIYLAAKYNLKQFVQVIIDTKKNIIDLDKYKNSLNKTARILIEENMLYNGVLPTNEIVETENTLSISTLYKNIREHLDTEFQTNFKMIPIEIIDSNLYSLLQMAIKHNLPNVVTILLRTNRINLNTDKEDHPLVLAAEKGYYNIVNEFMPHLHSEEIKSYALYRLFKSPLYTTDCYQNINYAQCIELLRSRNYNSYRNTVAANIALHCALKYNDQEMILRYLDNGASLGSIETETKISAIEKIDSDTLEKHLNKCIQVKYEETYQDTCYIINFRTLITKFDHDNNLGNIKNNNLVIQSSFVIQFISLLYDLQTYLKHPVISLFLFLKCYLLQSYHFYSFIYYLCILLLLLEISKHFTILSRCVMMVPLAIYIIKEFLRFTVNRKKSTAFSLEIRFKMILWSLILIIIADVAGDIKLINLVALIMAACQMIYYLRYCCMARQISMLQEILRQFIYLFLLYFFVIYFIMEYYLEYTERDEINNKRNSTLLVEEKQCEMNVNNVIMVILTGKFKDLSTICKNVGIYTLSLAIILSMITFKTLYSTDDLKNKTELREQMILVDFINIVEQIFFKYHNKKIIGFFIRIVLKNTFLFSNNNNPQIRIYPNKMWQVTLRNDPLNLNRRNNNPIYQWVNKIYCILFFKINDMPICLHGDRLRTDIKTLIREIENEANANGDNNEFTVNLGMGTSNITETITNTSTNISIKYENYTVHN